MIYIVIQCDTWYLDELIIPTEYNVNTDDIAHCFLADVIRAVECLNSS